MFLNRCWFLNAGDFLVKILSILVRSVIKHCVRNDLIFTLDWFSTVVTRNFRELLNLGWFVSSDLFLVEILSILARRAHKQNVLKGLKFTHDGITSIVSGINHELSNLFWFLNFGYFLGEILSFLLGASKNTGGGCKFRLFPYLDLIRRAGLTMNMCQHWRLRNGIYLLG